MKYFASPIIDVAVLMVIVVVGYCISTLRYASRGCRVVERWGEVTGYRIRRLLTAFSFIPFAALVFIPLARLLMWLLSLEPFESQFFASIALFGFGKYSELLKKVMKTGTHNGLTLARKAARSCQRKCSIVCECADWGETVLDCCQDPTISVCPLAEQYQIIARCNAHDVVEAVCQDRPPEWGQPAHGEDKTPLIVVKVPTTRVLMKKFDAASWEAELDALFADAKPEETDNKPAAAPQLQAVAQPEPAIQTAEPNIEEKAPSLPRRRHLAANKLRFNYGGCGFLVEDFEKCTRLVIIKYNEKGNKEQKEFIFFKDDLKYPRGIRALLAAGIEAFTATEQLENSPTAAVKAF